MEQTFSDEQEDVRTRRSRAETLGFWLRTLRDFARTAPREQWDVLRQDVRAGARLLTRNPGFSATAILTLARHRNAIGRKAVPATVPRIAFVVRMYANSYARSAARASRLLNSSV
jgi:hypothetical protein